MSEHTTNIDSSIDWVPSVEERDMNALFYENEDQASRLSLGSELTLYEIWRSWRSCHACSPVLLNHSTKSPLSAACRRRKEWQRKEKKKRRGFGEPHWTAQSDMLIAKLCKGNNCHNSTGGQNDPEPPSLSLSTCPSSTRYKLWFPLRLFKPVIICPDDVVHLSHVIAVVTYFWITS